MFDIKQARDLMAWLKKVDDKPVILYTFTVYNDGSGAIDRINLEHAGIVDPEMVVHFDNINEANKILEDVRIYKNKGVKPVWLKEKNTIPESVGMTLYQHSH
jgi:hypothetical protein